MIPDFDRHGNLPPGVHDATWAEFVERFGTNTHRLAQINGMWAALGSLKLAGCRRVYIDGSFVTPKDHPGDYDACWDTEGVDIDLLARIEPALLNFTGVRAAQRAKFRGEFFPAIMQEKSSGQMFLEFFQADKDGNAKGVVALDLGSM